jgi:hypothetical protein
VKGCDTRQDLLHRLLITSADVLEELEHIGGCDAMAGGMYQSEGA